MEKHVKEDLGKTQDLTMAVANLANAEEHLNKTFMKTGNKDYHELREAVRSLRSRAMNLLVKNKEGECWCAGKHLLISTVRFMEVAARTSPEEAREWLKLSAETEAILHTLQTITNDEKSSRGRIREVSEKGDEKK